MLVANRTCSAVASSTCNKEINYRIFDACLLLQRQCLIYDNKHFRMEWSVGMTINIKRALLTLWADGSTPWTSRWWVKIEQTPFNHTGIVCVVSVHFTWRTTISLSTVRNKAAAASFISYKNCFEGHGAKQQNPVCKTNVQVLFCSTLQQQWWVEADGVWA